MAPVLVPTKNQPVMLPEMDMCWLASEKSVAKTEAMDSPKRIVPAQRAVVSYGQAAMIQTLTMHPTRAPRRMVPGRRREEIGIITSRPRVNAPQKADVR